MSSSSTAAQSPAEPTAFPPPGIYGVTQRVTLLSATPGAVIHYTTDGSPPTTASPVFDPFKLPVLEATHEGVTEHTLHALASQPGLAPSPVATFTYRIERRAQDVYLTQEVMPGLYMIRDFDDTKMYLVLGRERALLIDAGLGAGDLRGLVEGLIGPRSLEVLITHGHPDHIARMGQFQGRYNVYMNHRDLPLVHNFIETLGYVIDPAQIIDVGEGAVFDLGGRTFTLYEVPGHSPGSVVALEEASGLLLAGDAVGSNRPSIVDSLWMQFPGMAKIDVYLSTLQVFRAKVRGKIKQIYGGHNDAPLEGERYLDNLQLAAQTLVDQGPACLTPSLRPTDVWQVVVGDRLTDPDWAAINVARDACLTAPPDKLATLSNLDVAGAALAPGFAPTTHTYTATVDAGLAWVAITPTATASRPQRLTINGQPAASGAAFTAQLMPGANVFAHHLTSPDGQESGAYSLVVHRGAASSGAA